MYVPLGEHVPVFLNQKRQTLVLGDRKEISHDAWSASAFVACRGEDGLEELC
jgi:hypothetical protein